MIDIEESLKNNKFTITAELAPVKGTDLKDLLDEALKIKDRVNGINVTDNQRAIMRSAPVAFSRLLVEKGISPVCQLTCRDRNRIALQSDLLALSILGVKNILLLTGDSITAGDHPQAKPVFDLDSIGLIMTAKRLMQGIDLSGRELKGKPRFFIGAAINPGAEPQELQAIQTLRKLEAGAQFFQTQLVFDIGVMERFLNLLEKEKVKRDSINILAGIFPLKSVAQARFLNEKVTGVKIPEDIIKRMEVSKNPEEEGIQIAWELIKELKRVVKGIHLMTMGNKKALEELLGKISNKG